MSETMIDQDALDLALGRMIRVLVAMNECGVTLRKPDGEDFPDYDCIYGQCKGRYDAFATGGQTLDEAVEAAFHIHVPKEVTPNATQE